MFKKRIRFVHDYYNGKVYLEQQPAVDENHIHEQSPYIKIISVALASNCSDWNCLLDIVKQEKETEKTKSEREVEREECDERIRNEQLTRIDTILMNSNCKGGRSQGKEHFTL